MAFLRGTSGARGRDQNGPVLGSWGDEGGGGDGVDSESVSEEVEEAGVSYHSGGLILNLVEDEEDEAGMLGSVRVAGAGSETIARGSC